MKMRRILLWGIPPVCIGLLVFFAFMPAVIQNQEQAFQSMRQKGWTVYLQNFGSGTSHAGGGQRAGDILIDKAGRIWVVGGGNGLGGVHVFNGSQWTSHEGVYSDLAISPQGEIWAVELPLADAGVQIYDGQQWERYELGYQIDQVEIDSRGRIWVTIGQKLAEVDTVGDKFTPRFSHPELSCGLIHSLDADEQGRIWAAVWGTSEDCSGLYVIDGETLERVPDQGMNLQHVVRTVFDDQGRAWVATQCGSVIMYDGTDWTSIVQGDTDTDDCTYSPQKLDGITLDNQGRVWAWDYDQVKLLEKGDWITLTDENFFLPDPQQYHRIFIVAVDRQNQVWIGTDEGVQSAAIQDARPLPENVVPKHRWLLSLKGRMDGSNLFLPPVLALLWLAAYLNMLPGVLLALGVGLLATYLMGGPFIVYKGEVTLLSNPFAMATLGGMVGGLAGGWLDRIHVERASSRSHSNYILAIVGLGVGFLFGICMIMFEHTFGPLI